LPYALTVTKSSGAKAIRFTGTDVSKEASDMVLLDDNFTSIVAAVEEGRIVYTNIRRFIKYILGSNIGEILTIAAAPLIGLGGVSVPPGNHLEKLSSDRESQYSIRINDQYRICFEWSESDAQAVEIVDYHQFGEFYHGSYSHKSPADSSRRNAANRIFGTFGFNPKTVG
jgi:RelE-like toxin of type II toxin-antitoxin system HigB